MNILEENLLVPDPSFPVDVFIADNEEEYIDVEPHWHEHIELLYMFEGQAVQQINGSYHKLIKGDMVILNGGDIHATACKQGDNVKILVIQFMPEIIHSYQSHIFESKYIMAFINNRNGFTYHLSEATGKAQIAYNLMMGIYTEFLQKEIGYEIFIKGYIYQLIASLLRMNLLDTYSSGVEEKELKRLSSLLKYIETNFDNKIDLASAAKMVNMSYFYFSRYFKKVTGRSFKEYMDFIRICEAEKRLLLEDKSISQIAYEVGFLNVSSFNRTFRKVRGCPPKEVRRAKTANKSAKT